MMETIKKNQTASVGKYSYQYVDIAQIHEYLESIGARYIQSIQRINEDDYVMTKRCFNDKWEDEWIRGARVVGATLVGVNNPAQQQGSALTYARRYSLLMAFGLATEDDDAQSLSTTKEITEEEAENYTLSFGKHKGKKLTEVPTEYVEWLLSNSKDERLIEIIKMTTGIVIPSEDEQLEKLKLISDINTQISEKDIDRDKIYNHYKVDNIKDLTIEQLRELKEKVDAK